MIVQLAFAVRAGEAPPLVVIDDRMVALRARLHDGERIGRLGHTEVPA